MWTPHKPVPECTQIDPLTETHVFMSLPWQKTNRPGSKTRVKEQIVWATWQRRKRLVFPVETKQPYEPEERGKETLTQHSISTVCLHFSMSACLCVSECIFLQASLFHARLKMRPELYLVKKSMRWRPASHRFTFVSVLLIVTAGCFRSKHVYLKKKKGSWYAFR